MNLKNKARKYLKSGAGERAVANTMAVETLIIPTYRLKDVGATVREYQRHFQVHRHEVPVVVFDDSPADVAERDLPLLLRAAAPPAFYVGPLEKAEFLEKLIEKIGKKYEPTLRKILKPSYGGNRNHAALYSLGMVYVSADDDMRPHGLFHVDEQELSEREVLKGCYIDKAQSSLIVKREADLIGAYEQVLGRKVNDLNGDSAFLVGTTIIDNLTDLYTNQTKVPLQPNTVTLVEGDINQQAKIVTAQTYRSGSADVDTIDYVNDFLSNPYHAFVNDMSLRYVLQGFRPCITSTNWRLDCGISGYDNREGLPPFFPTRLRFEDYVFRLWLQQPGVAAAHVGGVQTHYRNPYMRESLPNDLLNEAMANLLKSRLREQIKDLTPHTVIFERKIEISREESTVMLEVGREYFSKAIARAAGVLLQKEKCDPLTPEEKSNYLIGFARDIYEEYEKFDADSFYHKISRILNAEVKTIVETMDLWPTILRTVEEFKRQGKLPLKEVS